MSNRMLMAGLIAWAMVLGCDNDPPAARNGPVSHPVYIRKQLPAFGVEFTQPFGWTEEPPMAVGRIAQWARGTSLMAIDAVRDHRSGDVIAAELSREWGGKIEDMPRLVDGVRALRIRVPYSEEKPDRPTETVVLGRYGHHYIACALDPDGKDCWKDLEELVQSFKWIDVEHPTRHLAFHDKPGPLFEGLITVQYPKVMCLQPTDEKRKELPGVALAIMDFSSNYLDLIVSFQLLDAVTTKKARELPGQMLEMANKTLKPKQPFDLQPRAGKPGVFFSQMVDLEAPDGRPWQQVKGRFGYAMISDSEAVLINVKIMPRNFDHIPIYVKAAERIVESITVHPRALAMLAR